MSYITTAILAFGLGIDIDDDNTGAINFVNVVNELMPFQNFKLVNGEDWGGNKYPTMHIALGVFNHFDPQMIVEALNKISLPESVNIQLIVKDEHEYDFRIIQIGG